MYKIFIDNHIDYSASAVAPDGMSAFFWAVGQLLGPCRSGGADFYKIVDDGYEFIKD